MMPKYVTDLNVNINVHMFRIAHTIDDIIAATFIQLCFKKIERIEKTRTTHADMAQRNGSIVKPNVVKSKYDFKFISSSPVFILLMKRYDIGNACSIIITNVLADDMVLDNFVFILLALRI